MISVSTMRPGARLSFRMTGMAVVAAAVSACSTPADPVRMTLPATTVAMAPTSHPAYRSVNSVTVTGGKSTNPLWTSQVSGEDFRAALETSLELAGYAGDQGRPIAVSADLIRLDQPFVGVDLSVTSHVRYQVAQEGRLVFDETVSATGSAGINEAFIGSQRLRLANEKSIQENIKTFMTRFGLQAHRTSGR